MAKSKHRKKKNIVIKVTKKKELNIKEEIKYIIKCAINFETKIMSINELILFCTETGDAWLLDIADDLALDLARDRVKQEFSVIDMPYQFGVEWKYNYIIDNEKFIYIDKTGLSRIIIGYPTERLSEIIHKSKYLSSKN
ncbi:MAG TPA: hypothetical protein ENI76_04835 [Ignavibacteria bacterium]|nr:hypothetical protein [Ignavibacteria bacterium]